MIRNLITILTALIILGAAPSQASEVMTESQRKAVQKTVDEVKKAFLSKDADALASLLYPEILKAMGGKEQAVKMIKAEEEKNAAAGAIIESMVYTLSDTVYTGTDFKLTFVSTIMTARTGDTRMESKSFNVAFIPLHGDRWYLLDGTRLSLPQFRSLFRGFPEDLKLPAVEKKIL